MKRWLLALVFAFALASALLAQAAPTLYWEHDGANLTHFTCQIDSGSQVSLLGLVSQAGTTYSTALSNCGTLAVGSHFLYVRACNGATCGNPSTGIYVVKL